MAARVISLYTLAVAAALALLFASLFWLPWPQYAHYLETAAWIAISGVMVAAFVWDYMRYAIVEWGDFTPQGAGLMVLFTLAYALMYASLVSLALFLAGGLNLAVWAAFIASAALALYLMRGAPLHVTSGAPLLDIMAGARLLPLALAVGLPLAWIFIAGYEAARMVSRGARVAGGIALASIALALLLYPLPLSVHGAAALGLAPMQFSGVEVLAWPGIIAWEELTSRFLLPAVGPVANYMFVALHAPTRWLALLVAAPAILAVISMATRWTTDVYRRHGLIGAISAHSVYNGMIPWIMALIYFPALTAATLAVLAYAYIRHARASA